MILSERLSVIAGYVPWGLIVADIGTDHALLPIYLVTQEISPYVIACDLCSGPLESARANIYYYKLADKVEIRQGDGLEPLNQGEVEVIIIAGMGGAKIIDILETSSDVLDEIVRIILQPQRGAEIVRRWLYDYGWEIIDEDLVLENSNYYEIIIAEHSLAG
ncbi:MAG: class I SAM-dependent methyltransferase, partial [Syntrophaceticus sp.]|nr:class I SAM-dependent methyltransferase [Desulfitobacteriaceae bacterium]MDD4783969.1 class I SAM-dependent methyltransferase [Syntrophaceticus sp.]